MSGLAETAKLVSSLELKDNFTPTANKAMKSLGKMESTAFRVGQNIGKGFNNAAHNLKRMAQVGVVALGGAIALGVRSLGDLARTQNQTNAVIESTGGKAKVTAAEVRKYAESLEDLSTVDDKVIQDGENLLLTFPKISGKIFPEVTKAALDMSLAMAGGNVEQVDLKSSSIQLGKALSDPVKGITALTRVGVTFSAKQKKRIADLVKEGKVLKAQKIILAEVNKEFGKSSEAAGKGPEAVMRRLADAGEDLSQILARGTLPVLERFGKFLTQKLSDPAFMAQVDEFGRNLGIAGGKLLDFIEKIDFKAIGAGLQVAATAAGTLVGWFLKMPTWVQAAVVGGWGLNKLTGGALTGVLGALAGGLGKWIGQKIGLMTVQAAVVNVSGGVGGVPGVPGAPAPVAGGGSGLIGTAIKLAGVVTLAAVASEFGPQIQQAGRDLRRELVGDNFPKLDRSDLSWPFGPKDTPTILPQLGGNGLLGGRPSTGTGGKADESRATLQAEQTTRRGLDALATKSEKTTTAIETMKGNMAKDLAGNKAAIDAAASLNTHATSTAGSLVSSAVYANAATVAGAVRASRPIVTTDVRVYVSAAGVTKSITSQNRYGPGNGSDGGGFGSGADHPGGGGA